LGGWDGWEALDGVGLICIVWFCWPKKLDLWSKGCCEGFLVWILVWGCGCGCGGGIKSVGLSFVVMGGGGGGV